MGLVIFNDEESDLIYHSISVITQNNMTEEAGRIKKNIDALVELVRAISQYPSILATSKLCNVSRSVGTLMEMLSTKEGQDKIMYTPTKAVLGKGFLVAKISFFNMLSMIVKELPELNEKVPIITKFIADTIYTIMGEEVFLAILEDKESNDTIRNRAGFLLANVWEYRLNEGVSDFAPILNSMWEARKRLIPIFGTLMGTMELCQMSANLDPVWEEFLLENENSEEVFESLEEFLFSLAYEELNDLRKKMEDQGLSVITRKDLESLMSHKKLYDDFDIADPREMYRFFRDRKLNARFRKRAETPGPKKTIEEHIMCYLLSSQRWIPH
ncbi:MAG: hypothetical protein GY754_17710 [bacterium]|nr:hypothetical protein [bacterium]